MRGMSQCAASVAPIDGLVVGLAYTYTDSEDRTTGDPLRRIAKNALAVTATWEPLPGLTLSGEVQVLSSQFEAPGQPRWEPVVDYVEDIAGCPD